MVQKLSINYFRLFVTISIFLLFLFSKTIVNQIRAINCPDPGCTTTSECVYPAPTPISGGIATCVKDNCNAIPGEYCKNDTGTNIGFCSCSIGTSIHCTPPGTGAWSAWGTCTGGYEQRYCTTYGPDMQNRLCTTPEATGGPTAAGSTPTPTPVPPPTCTMSLSPGTTNLTLGGADGTITATVTCSANINSVEFDSSNTTYVTITSAAIVVGTGTTANIPVTVHGVATGSSVITGRVYINGTEIKNATAIANVSPLSAWFGVKDSDVFRGGDLTTKVIHPQVFWSTYVGNNYCPQANGFVDSIALL